MAAPIIGGKGHLHRDGARGDVMPKLNGIIEKTDALCIGDANHVPAGNTKCAPKGTTKCTPKGGAKASWDQDDAKLVGPGDGMENMDNNGLASPLGMLGGAKEGQQGALMA
ncbi:unnamed protein product, partial [Ilex paraguariensis]